MPIPSGVGARFKARHDSLRADHGTDFLRLLREGHGVIPDVAEATYRGVFVKLALADFPEIQAQFGRHLQINIFELNPQRIDFLAADIDLIANDYILFPAGGDPAANRYRIEAVNPDYIANTLCSFQGLAFAAPVTE